MPTKKGGKKQKKPSQKDNEPIKQMPSLVFNNIRETNDAPEIEKKDVKKDPPKSTPNKPIINLREKFLEEQLGREKKLSFWLWIGVIGLGIVIAFFWGYSLWANFSTINWKKTEENKIIDKTSSDWDQTFKEIKENEIQNQLTKLQIKEVLSTQIQKQFSNTSVVVTSPSSTTSTAENTNTTTSLNKITTSSSR